MAPNSSIPPISISFSSTNQPNLSNCHSCNHQTNPTNPRDTLQPLDSVWRIILVCKKCHKTIISGQTCPYCLKPIINSAGDFFKCSICDNQIHMSCVRDYLTCTPWCYSGIRIGHFITCIDCWIPDFRRISVRFFGVSESKRLLDKELAVRFRRIFSRVPRVTESEFCIDPCDLRVWRILNWNGLTYNRRNGNGDKVGLVTYKRDKNRKVVKIDDVRSDEEFELDSDIGGTSCSVDVLESLLCFDVDESGSCVDVSAELISSCINVERFGENFATYKRKQIATSNLHLVQMRIRKHAQMHVSSTNAVLEPLVCQLNQSPWDVMTGFSPPSSLPLPGPY